MNRQTGNGADRACSIIVSRSSKDHDFATAARGVVEQVIGEKLDGSPLRDPNAGKNPAAVALGKLGGAKDGKARAEKLTPMQRSKIAKTAANVRWSKRGRKPGQGHNDQ